MQIFAICAVAVALLSAVHAVPAGRGHGTSHHNEGKNKLTKRNLGHHYHQYCEDEPAEDQHAVKSEELVPNRGWYQFRFGDTDRFANTNFYFTTQYITLITFTDGYCEGDSFVIYDNGEEWLRTKLKNRPPYTCSHFDNNPENCALSEHFGNAKGFLLPGRHNITIKSLNSPYHAGSAFIKSEVVCNFEGTLYPCCQTDMSCSRHITRI